MTDRYAKDCTILIVEDVFMVRRTLELILKSAGYKVVDAPDAGVATAMIQKGQIPDLILLDVMMPGIDGVKFAGMLKAHEPTRHVPVVMCTARGDKATVTQSYVQGVAGFIVKPFTKDIVLNKVNSLLGVVPEKPKVVTKKRQVTKKRKKPKAAKGQTKKRTKSKTTRRPFSKKTKKRKKKSR